MPAEKKKPVSLNNINVCFPTEVEIADRMANEKEIARWWEKAKLLAKAMRSLDRVTMLCYDHESDRWYLASVEETPDAR